METPGPTPGEHAQDALPARPARTPKWPAHLPRRGPRRPPPARARANVSTSAEERRARLKAPGPAPTPETSPRPADSPPPPGHPRPPGGVGPPRPAPRALLSPWSCPGVRRARGRAAAARSQARWELRDSAASEEIRPALTAP